MKRSRVVTLLFFLALSVLMPNKVNAQIIEVGATGGVSYYIGDINPGKQLNHSDLAIGGIVRYYNNLRWAFRFQYSNMSLQGVDETGFYEPVKESFISKVNDFSLLAEFNFFDYWTGCKQDFITPYIFAGLSFFAYNTKGSENNAISNGNGFSVPFGLGIKYSLCNRIGLNLEWRMHKSFVDDIDNVEDFEYYSNGNLNELPLAYRRDWYSMLGLSVVYRFNLPKRTVCNSGIKPRK